jgi:putative DNA primase/helicase
VKNISHNRFSSREKIISDSDEKISGGPNGEHPPNDTEAIIPRRNKYYSCNDEGRAHRFIDYFGEYVRFVPEQGIWLIWNGTRWKIDTDGEMERLAMQMCRLMGIAAFSIKGKEGRSSAIGEAEKCGDYAVISNYLKLARKIKSIILNNEYLIPKPWIVAAKNGIVDLRTGKIRDYSREDFVMYTSGCIMDANADCPRFKQYMREVLPDYHVRRFVQKAVGYSLTGIGSEHIFLFLYGDGRNGKSTFVRVLKRLFGRYALVSGPKLFYSVEYHPTPDDQVAELFGKRIVFASESRERARLNEDFMKHVTGGEEIRGCWKYKHGFEFQPQVVPWISGNHKPKISGIDEGIWSRVRLVPFEKRFVGKNRILNLDLQLFEELPGYSELGD